MEEFEKIKETAHDAIKSNVKNVAIVENWKKDIRSCLIRIRKKFTSLIDKFIYQFGDSFKAVEK